MHVAATKTAFFPIIIIIYNNNNINTTIITIITITQKSQWTNRFW